MVLQRMVERVVEDGQVCLHVQCVVNVFEILIDLSSANTKMKGSVGRSMGRHTAGANPGQGPEPRRQCDRIFSAVWIG